jgi:O-antigen ligase
MALVAWWTGKGYLTILIVLGSAIVFELARAALNLPDGVWIFGLALFGAAAANWFLGRKINRKSLSKVRSSRLKERLIYRARHKFMSLPMETFSILLGLAGMVIIGSAIIA